MKFNEYSVDDQKEIFRDFFGLFMGTLASTDAINKMGFERTKEIANNSLIQELYQHTELVLSFIQDFIIFDLDFEHDNEKVIENEVNGYLENISSVDEFYNLLQPERVKQIINEEDWESYLYAMSLLETALNESLNS